MLKERKLLIVLLVMGFVWRLCFSWRSLEQLVSFPLVDDGFYSLNIARNLSRGLLMTYDGINATNGFQPLYVFLAVPFYWLFPNNQILPIHFILSGLSLVSVISGFFIFKLVELLSNKKAALFAVLVWCLSPTVIEFELNGLETGLNVFFIIVSSYYYLVKIRGLETATNRNYIFLGGLLGLTILTRIDSGFYCLVMGIDFLWVNRKNLKKKFRYFLIVAGICSLLASPWFLYNQIRFGSLMPVSLRAVRMISLSPNASGFHAAGDNFPISPIPIGYYLVNIKKTLVKMGRAPIIEAIFWPGLLLGYQWLGYALLLVIGLLVAILIVFDWKRTKQYLEKIAQVNYLLAFCLTILTAYIFYVFGQWYYVRYYFPILVISIIYSAFVYDLSLNKLLPRISVGLSSGLKIILVVFLLVSFNYRLRERFRGSETVHKYYDVAKWINENLPIDAKIGAFQSGTIGYFSKTNIINLDGVVNKDACVAMKEKRMLRYIENSGIEYVIDWPWMIEDYLWKSSRKGVDRTRLRLLKENIYGYNLYQVLANKPANNA